MLDDDRISLLTQVFKNSLQGSTKASAQQFRARNAAHLDALDWLQQHGYIRNSCGYYLVRPPTLAILAKTDAQAESLLYLCEHLFRLLSAWYQQNAGKQIDLQELAALAEIPLGQVRTAVEYLNEAIVFDNTSGTADEPICSMEPSERMLRFRSFSDMSAEQQREANGSRATLLTSINFESVLPESAFDAYVDAERLIALKQLETTTSFDLRKLISLCEELNDCWARGNLFAIGGLLRTLLDHIPPIFERTSFREVANNSARRSVKKTLMRLESSSRDISDSLLHDTIRRSVDLPTRTRVNFSHDLDVLLGEICQALS